MLAIADSRGRTVWDDLREDAGRHARKMRALIQHTARNGPPRAPQKSKPLRDGVFELRSGPKRGPKLRVFYFYDAGRMAICTHSAWKREAVPEEIDKAVAWRSRYFLAKSRGAVGITDSLTTEQEGENETT